NYTFPLSTEGVLVARWESLVAGGSKGEKIHGQMQKNRRGIEDKPSIPLKIFPLCKSIYIILI
ncbi:MAG: hypothetical protein K2P04_05395, partial [Oscillospiraceae bacterium]|nr:hypothetical protein [Oscillospiraceae bacterium]